jgi:hypothetical protein
MTRSSALFLALTVGLQVSCTAGLQDEPAILRRACPDYVSYSTVPQYVTTSLYLYAICLIKS